MKKMTTLYVTLFDTAPSGKGRVFRELSKEVRQENEWVFTDPTTKAYRKLDGTASAIINGVLYARYMVITGKSGKQRTVPVDGIPAQPMADESTGQHPYWVPTQGKPEYKHHNTAFDKEPNLPDGTYELCGKKINQNKENLEEDSKLLNHDDESLIIDLPEKLTYDSLKNLIENLPYEGLVFKNDSGDTCKLRRVDFKLKY